MSTPEFNRLLRFIPKSLPTRVLIGEPESPTVDIGAALHNKEKVNAFVWSGNSVLEPGSKTDHKEAIERVLSPLAREEVGTIRCIGLNYLQHAKELNAELPTVPTVFLKPSDALADPWPASVNLPHITQGDDSGDYESELAVIIGRTCKNVTKENAIDYVLGYTAANDVSSRGSQFAQSQWCFSKGFDGSCPIGMFLCCHHLLLHLVALSLSSLMMENCLIMENVGPVIVSKQLVPNPSQLHIRGLKNSVTMQSCGIDDLIFSIPEIISFLSQSTTLRPGTVILTGTPAGVGAGREPKETLRRGDTFSVEILPHIGTLMNYFENEV
ncbi:fumarylacetoacetate hydrolase family protein [Paramyrothecium foliicola]|nr:fumarylacetoacetate hydrolase family protein [Paramyrothecium foliicola]